MTRYLTPSNIGPSYTWNKTSYEHSIMWWTWLRSRMVCNEETDRGCHYFLPSPRLPSQLQRVTVLGPYHLYCLVNDFPGATAGQPNNQDWTCQL